MDVILNVNAWLPIPLIGGTLIVTVFVDDIKENGFKEPENSPPYTTEPLTPAVMRTFLFESGNRKYDNQQRMQYEEQVLSNDNTFKFHLCLNTTASLVCWLYEKCTKVMK